MLWLGNSDIVLMWQLTDDYNICDIIYSLSIFQLRHDETKSLLLTKLLGDNTSDMEDTIMKSM